MTDQVAKIGTVITVTGTRVVGQLERQHLPSRRPVRIGDLVQMRTSGAVIFGVIDGLDAGAAVQTYEAGGAQVHVELLGQVLDLAELDEPRRFEPGVSAFPGLGDPIFETSHADIATVYDRPWVATMRIGIIHQDPYLPAHVATDDLLAKHFAVVGSTGSGKSCAVALILRRLLERHPNAHVLLLDPHNEYRSAFGDLAEYISPQNLQLPVWLLNFEEAVEVLVSREGADRPAQTAILKEALTQAKRAYCKDKGLDEGGQFTVDTPIPYRLSDLTRAIQSMMGKLDKPDNSPPYLRLLSRLESLTTDRRFAFMFSGLMLRDSMAEVLSRLLRIPVAGRPITIMDLSAVPSEIVDVVVSILCRTIFDFALWSGQGMSVPLLLVCEEAHRYAPDDDRAGFGPTRRAIARIAKEGRKYGVSLCLVTQRPSELATSILSQCGTIFSMRLSNERDQEYIRRVLPEGAQGLMSALATLRSREAVAVGVGVPVPMRVLVDRLPPEFLPRSASARFSEVWQTDHADSSFVEQTVRRWRLQQRSDPARETRD